MKHANFLTGLVVGALVFGGTTVYAAGILAERSTNRIFVDGQEVQIEAYAIHDNNFMQRATSERPSVSTSTGTPRMGASKSRQTSPTPAKRRQKTKLPTMQTP